MWSEFDIRAYLVSEHDMAFFEGEEEQATDQMNQMLHFIADNSDEDDSLEQLEEVVRRTLYAWIEEPELLGLDSEEMEMYVLEQLAEVRQQEEDTDE